MSRINNFVGYLLSIESKNVFYQGIVSSIDVNRDVMFVKNCFQNGVSCGDKIVEIRISEIEHIDILADASNAMNVLKPKPQTVAPQIEELPRQSTAKSKQPSMNSRGQNNHHHHHHHQYSEDEISTTNNRRGHNHNHNNRAEKNGLNDVKSFDEEFDFEKNLALFDKNAFYEEVTQNSDVLPISSQSQQNTPQPSSTFLKILASARTTKPIKLSNSANNLSTTTKSDHQSGKNYRFDEMILDTGDPINFQQIQVPRSSKHYVTDEGYEVPCIDNELRTRLFEESYQQGLSRSRQIECMGRNCAEMALQLVGGSIRFSVKNSHQKPAFLVLANSGSLQGSYALCTARLLANRQAKIYVLVYASVGANGGAVLSADELVSRADSAVAFNGIRDERLKLFWSELALLRSSAGDNRSNLRFVSSLDEIQELGSIDMILNGLDANFPIEQKVNASWIKRLAKQIESSKAYVLTIDPSSEASAIQSKWNIAPVLPLEISNQSGRVYLCDLGFTKSMFQAVNIKYESPFGSKFLIPLHDD